MTWATYQKTIRTDCGSVKIWYKRKDGTTFYLNPHLIRERKIGWMAIKGIIKAHKEKDAIINAMMCVQVNHINMIKHLRLLAKEVTKIEYRLQKLWHFKKDKKFHRFWELPHCSCPRMDNEDRYPSKNYIINYSCILHGSVKKC